MKILFYNKISGELVSCVESDSYTSVETAASIIYGSGASKILETLDGIIVEEIPEFDKSSIIDTNNKTLKANPDYIPPTPSPVE